ncbi:MAG: malate:quinone oxidoreductase [Rothia sp. (in: high G+C Gram-positive bacteria)]|nr:malate:quinone oxidoreductase [Rothia sp. (in: high G+C Gram-positive bacteria)]
MAQEVKTDVVLVGGGIMSATLGVLLKEVEPTWNITLLERLGQVGQEASNPWNNAGTGHSALCELNYAPAGPDGNVDPTKALSINEQFQISRQLWASLLEEGKIKDANFINPVPHMSLVFGEDHVNYLGKRFEALESHKLFERMKFSTDLDQIRQWAPLAVEGRDPAQKIAATWSPEGTDVDFGNLTEQMVNYLAEQGVTVQYGQQVTNLKQQSDGSWLIDVTDRLASKQGQKIRAKFVFLGAGGGALPLLQKSGIKEGKGFGGFPVSGLFFRNTNEETALKHNAKVYGQASVGAPPMSVPHLDTRYVNGQRSLLFGPYAGFRTNFLKNGSLLDLPLSLRPDNLIPMVRAGLDNLDLTKYLVGEVVQKIDKRVDALRQYYPTAVADEWELITAGQRVQVIKKDAKKGGVLQFGTELIASGDGSIAALLGASPGASTAAPIMLTLLARCFPSKMNQWETRIKELVPGYGVKLNDNHQLADELFAHTAQVLGLNN